MLDRFAQDTLDRSVSIDPWSNRVVGRQVEVVGHSAQVMVANLQVPIQVKVEVLAEVHPWHLVVEGERVLVDSVKGPQPTHLR